MFEELIRRFSGISNETAGEHFTRREVIRLIVDLLIANDDAKLAGRGIIRPVYDPACGTGGRLALTEEGLTEFNPNIRVELFGCEIPDAARAEILRLYADFVNGDSGESEVSKIFRTTEFGYREIQVECPLKLNFQVDDERLVRLEDEGQEGDPLAPVRARRGGGVMRLRHMVSIGPTPNEIRGLGADDAVALAPMDALADGLERDSDGRQIDRTALQAMRIQAVRALERGIRPSRPR